MGLPVPTHRSTNISPPQSLAVEVWLACFDNGFGRRTSLYKPKSVGSINTMRRLPLAIVALLVALAGTSASPAPGDLTSKLDSLLAGFNPHAVVGVLVRSLDRDATLYERNSRLSFNPASNQKLLTSAGALAMLGSDYRFRTEVLALGLRHGQDTLRGDLVLRGGGDPSLEPGDLADLADAVRSSGIRTVTGRLRADDFRYDDRRLGAGWSSGGETYYYSAQISALSVGRNVVRIDLFPHSRPGGKLTILQHPVADYLEIDSRLSTGPAKSVASISIRRDRARNRVVLEGSLPSGSGRVRRLVTMEEPQRHAAALFRDALTQREVTVQGPIEWRRTPLAARVIGVHESPPLAEIIALMNKPSDNLMAEMLLKEIGVKQRGKGSARAGAAALAEWLAGVGVDLGGARINDGSGLSRLDLLTPRAVCQLLQYADTQAWGAAFRDSLPIAGVDGTLRRRMKGTKAEGNVRAKTGTLSHVSALSGYLRSASGERLIFSVMTNNLPDRTTPAKRLEDAIAVALAE